MDSHDRVIVTGAADTSINGSYYYNGEHDGYPYFLHTTSKHLIIYMTEYGPYSFSPSYYLVKVTTDNYNYDPIRVELPKYKTASVTAGATWTSMMPGTSGETATITSTFDDESSSSSNSSSSSTEIYSRSSSSSKSMSSSSTEVLSWSSSSSRSSKSSSSSSGSSSSDSSSSYP